MSLIDLSQLGEKLEPAANPVESDAKRGAGAAPEGDPPPRDPPPRTADPGSSAAALRRARREDVVARAAAEVGVRGRGTPAMVAVVRSFDEGSVVVALAGPVGPDAVEWLADRLRELRPRATRELVLELAGVTDRHHWLARLIGQVRIRHLVDEARVEVRNPPPALGAELRYPTPGFTVHDDRPAAPGVGSPAPATVHQGVGRRDGDGRR